MPLNVRTVTISLRFATTQPAAKTVRFIPDLAQGDGQTLLEKFYDATLNTGIGTVNLSGFIALPVRSSGAIPYRVEFPETVGKNSHYINLEEGDGSPVELSQLLTTVV